jgi:hypothetical protein
MKVRLTSSRFGHVVKKDAKGKSYAAGLFTQAEGQEVDLPNAEAQGLISRGQAVEVKDSNK